MEYRILSKPKNSKDWKLSTAYSGQNWKLLYEGTDANAILEFLDTHSAKNVLQVQINKDKIWDSYQIGTFDGENLEIVQVYAKAKKYDLIKETLTN